MRALTTLFVWNPIRTQPAPKHRDAAHMRRSAAVPLPRLHEPDASGRSEFLQGGSMHAHPRRTPKQNAPGHGDPRAFALPREIGVTDLREGISRLSESGCQVVPFIARKQARVAMVARHAWLVCGNETE